MAHTDNEKNGNGRVSVTVILSILGMIIPPLVVWGDGQRKSGELDQRVTQIEKRQAEDRASINSKLTRIEDRAQRTDDNVQLILRKLDVMDAQAKQRDSR